AGTHRGTWAAAAARARWARRLIPATASAANVRIRVEWIGEGAELRARRDHSGDAGFLEAHAQRSGAERERIARAAIELGAVGASARVLHHGPVALHLRDEGVHVRHRRRRCPAIPI